jgi:hypothetical protein
LVLQTYVTTGNPSLPTPVGTYTILASSIPTSSSRPGRRVRRTTTLLPYRTMRCSSATVVTFFTTRRGGGFGPGTNGQGQPGTNYGGTHGCINIPLGPTLFLWNWAPVGTRVSVVR